MRPGARRVGAVSALTVGIMTALTSGMASSTAVAAPSHSVTEVKGVHALSRQAGVDLAVTKDGPASATEGDVVTYTITVTNNSASPSSGYTVTDYLPTGIRGVVAPPGCAIPAPGRLVCTHGALAGHASATITVTGTAGQDFTNLQNIVTVEGVEADTDYTNNAAAVRTAVARRQADLSLTKSGPSTAPANSQVTYTLTVRNNGPHASTGWTVSDQLPATLHGPYTTSPGCSVSVSNLLTCTGGPLAVGATATVTVTGTAGPGFNGVRNTAVVRGLDFDPSLGNNTASNRVTQAGLRITKTAEAPHTIHPGDTVRYTVRVRNTGDMDYVGAAQAHFTDDLTDLLDDARYNDDADATRGVVGYAEPRLTWTGDLRRGETVTIRYSITVDSQDFGNLRLQNGLVSDNLGSNCPTANASRDCWTLGTVQVQDKAVHPTRR